jgi:sarcosine oxidase subunit gamma
MGADLAGHFFSLVDLSHATVGFAVSGEHAAAILNAGCPLDLRDRSFPVGMATRTVLGKAEIILIRQEAASYLVECRRSFATYVAAFLREAARDAGA